MNITLPNPCPVCRGPVVYSGRGRRPEYCSPTCHRAARAEAARERRTAKKTAESCPAGRGLSFRQESQASLLISRARRAQRVVVDDPVVLGGSVIPEYAVRQDARSRREHGEPVDDFAEVGIVPDRWADRSARRRDDDEAARWLAEHHQDALHDFPPAIA